MKKKKSDDLVIYNEAQRWWVNVSENCKGIIQQFENSMKLQKEILIMADKKIKEEATAEK
jgi:hypothetical protein